MATLRNIAVSLLYLAGITEITRTLQSISRDRNRVLGILPLQGFNEGAGSVQPSGRLDGLNVAGWGRPEAQAVGRFRYGRKWPMFPSRQWTFPEGRYPASVVPWHLQQVLR